MQHKAYYLCKPITVYLHPAMTHAAYCTRLRVAWWTAVVVHSAAGLASRQTLDGDYVAVAVAAAAAVLGVRRY